MRALVVAVVLVLAMPALAGAGGGADVRAIRALLKQQVTLVKQGKFRAMYRTTTPRLRARCPYARYARGLRESRRVLGPTARIDRIQVRFKSAKRALVSYRFLKNGKPLLTVRFRDGDLYAKLGSRWYDEYDRIAC